MIRNTRVASHLARSDIPSITCIEARISCSDTPTYPSDQWQGSTRGRWRAPADRPQDFHAKLNFTHLNSIPLIPACTARPGLPLSPPEIAFLESPYYRPQTASIADRHHPTNSIQSPTHKTMTLHSKPDPTMITNHFCACGLFSKWNIRQNCFVFVEFWTTFFRVSTCFNGSTAAMDAQLGFGTRLRWFCDRGVW